MPDTDSIPKTAAADRSIRVKGEKYYKLVLKQERR
jgi:hypothetical protein